MTVYRLKSLTKTGLDTELGKMIQSEIPVGGCHQAKYCI